MVGTLTIEELTQHLQLKGAMEVTGCVPECSEPQIVLTEGISFRAFRDMLKTGEFAPTEQKQKCPKVCLHN